MKVLFEMVVASLASSCEERQQMGARCLGELVRKMGDKIINEILPILEQNQQSEEVEKRVGVAIALHEIIDNMSKVCPPLLLSHFPVLFLGCPQPLSVPAGQSCPPFHL